MNKKVLVLVITIIILLFTGGLIYYFTNSSTENTNKNVNEDNRRSEARNEDVTLENNENTESQTNSENTTNSQTGKVLVLYYSQSGNTEKVANFIHNHVGGDIIKLETKKEYPSEYNDLINDAKNEQNENARPELKTVIENIEQYDTIFLGYPNWWADMPMGVYTFLDNYDLSGKRVAPFITHGGSGLSGTPDKIKREEPQATVTKGLSISGTSASSSENNVVSWLKEIGF